MIDLHCHVLPAVDDGPATMNAALELADALIAAGVERVIATPHVSPTYANDADRIGKVVTLLERELERSGRTLQVEAGAELDLGQIADLGASEVAELRLGPSGTLLVECPFSRVAPNFETRVRRLMVWGNQVLLAHPERSPLFLREPALLARLVADGALASVTGASLVGRFGSTAQRFATWAIDEGLAHNVATDAHDTRRRPPILGDALADSGYGWAADWLTVDVPDAILRGAPLPARPTPTRMLPWARKRRAAPRGR